MHWLIWRRRQRRQYDVGRETAIGLIRSATDSGPAVSEQAFIDQAPAYGARPNGCEFVWYSCCCCCCCWLRRVASPAEMMRGRTAAGAEPALRQCFGLNLPELRRTHHLTSRPVRRCDTTPHLYRLWYFLSVFAACFAARGKTAP